MVEFYERRRALSKGERTRERLLRAAVDRFGSHGYRATSVSQLSRDAGLTPAAAYAYFDDKESFWRAAIAADLDVLQAEIFEAARRDERPLVGLMTSLVAGLQRHPLARRVMVEGSPADLQLVLAHQLFAGITQRLRGVLAARKAAGLLPASAEPDQFALGLETVMFSLVVSVVRAGLEESPERIEAVVALMQAAAGGPPTFEERHR
ncbi:MAG: TetR/AcrR family transcriptional regulator [Actinomycetota bacterium]|nr:TetR/AcrR family transcriptional regulator [Actinomycetota bacterium]